MTDTAYLYQYFLEHSSVKKDTTPKDSKKEKEHIKEQEVRRDGKYARQHA